ncbi:MAG: cytochrome P450 [Actinomycetota bacterium]|nr:cytochrome P450 [Actinomycetota bacterium]
MIVRIATENQYRLPDDQEGPLNDLDNALVAAVEAGDEARFRELFEQMLELVRTGDAVDGDDLTESEVILPPPDISLEEAREEFTGEGLIPG